MDQNQGKRVGGSPSAPADFEAKLAASKGEAAADTPPIPDSKSGISETTLGANGLFMPIGIAGPDGTLNKGFSIRPWRMKEEKELAQAKKDDPGQNLATYVSTVVAYMCTRLGHHDFNTTRPEEKRVYVSQMYMADIWYVYASIRRDALGDLLKLTLKCPRCRKDFPWAGSLATLAVKTADSLGACMWTYLLAHPLTIRGKTVHSLQMGPQRWNVAESVFSNPNEGQAKEAAIRASIYSLNDSPERAQLLSSDLDEMTKLDIERIASAIDEHFIGPNMSIEIDKSTPCTHCGFDQPRRIPIDWTFDHFFGVSSH